MSQQTKKRDPSLDLVRCIALFFVMAVHFCTHCDIYSAGYTGIIAFLTELLRTLYVPALALFIMLNGYFQNKRTLSGKYYLGILKLYEMYLLCAVLNLLYSHFYLGAELSVKSFFGSIINFEASEYSWYVLLYNGLFLMIPFLNIIYNSLTCRGHKRVLILTFFFLSALPSSFLNVFVNLDAFWWQRIWPIMFYFMGAYVREYREELSGKRWGIWLAVTLTVFALYNYLLYHEESPLFGLANNVFLYSHESLQNAVLTPLVFLFTLDVRLDGWSKPILKMMKVVSDCSYGAFLFSSITDSFVYGWLNRLVPVTAQRYLFFVIALPVSYVSAVFLAYLADKPVKAADKIIRPLAERFILRLYTLTAPDAVE